MAAVDCFLSADHCVDLRGSTPQKNANNGRVGGRLACNNISYGQEPMGEVHLLICQSSLNRGQQVGHDFIAHLFAGVGKRFAAGLIVIQVDTFYIMQRPLIKLTAA